MPTNVSKMTKTEFVMRIAISEKEFVDVTITGEGLLYDTRSGMLKGGEIDSISLNSLVKTGSKTFSLTSVEKISGINMSSNELAERFGEKFWNNAKIVVDKFDAFHGLHDQTTYSYFSAAKNFTKASEFSDVIKGSNFHDNIDGGSGDDELFGAFGNDKLFGGRGDDTLSGDAGNDLLIDKEGDNSLLGGLGDDKMRGSDGADIMNGGAGVDVIYGAGGKDLVTGGWGRDSFVFDMKESGKMVITDFSAGDYLVNLNAGSAGEAYEIFMKYAYKDGKNIVFDYGDMHLVLKNVKMSSIDISDFADASTVAQSGLF